MAQELVTAMDLGYAPRTLEKIAHTLIYGRPEDRDRDITIIMVKARHNDELDFFPWGAVRDMWIKSGMMNTEYVRSGRIFLD